MSKSSNDKGVTIWVCILAVIFIFLFGCPVYKSVTESRKKHLKEKASGEPSKALIKYAVEVDAQDKLDGKFRHLGKMSCTVNEYQISNKSEGMLNGQKMVTYQYYAKLTGKLVSSGKEYHFDSGGAIRFVKNGNEWNRVFGIWTQ